MGNVARPLMPGPWYGSRIDLEDSSSHVLRTLLDKTHRMLLSDAGQVDNGVFFLPLLAITGHGGRDILMADQLWSHKERDLRSR